MIVIAILKIFLFFLAIIMVSAIVFGGLVATIGKFFNVAIALDSVFAKIMLKKRNH